MKCVSYSIFGYGKPQPENCFSHASYLRGLAINLRLNRILYPDWVTVIHVDKSTHDAFGQYFNDIANSKVEVIICPDAPLCLAMLWRLKPVFERVWDSDAGGYTGWKYTHVICRDVDSPPTYREVQAVEKWVADDSAAHAITDSVSHTIPMMGGMIGFRPHYFSERVGVLGWQELIGKGHDINYENKGSDQDFLNRHVYPYFARQGNSSITAHYFSGHPNNFLPHYHTCTCPPPSGHAENCPNNYKIDLPDELKESNSICGHVGSSGSYSTALEKFLRKFSGRFDDINLAEKSNPDIFYWQKDGSIP